MFKCLILALALSISSQSNANSFIFSKSSNFEKATYHELQGNNEMAEYHYIQSSKEGNPYASYKLWAMYVSLSKNNDEYFEKANPYLIKAAYGGVFYAQLSRAKIHLSSNHYPEAYIWANVAMKNRNKILSKKDKEDLVKIINDSKFHLNPDEQKEVHLKIDAYNERTYK